MAAVPTLPAISVEEYITRFAEGAEKPSCEYVDGELIRKPLPSREHSQVQANISFYIRLNFKAQFNPLPELTTRVSKTKFFVPDLAVEDRSRPITGRYPGPDEPVFLCVEIKSHPDRIGKLFGKCEEYHSWGVPHCWIVDPDTKLAWEYLPDDPEPRKVHTALTAGPIQIPLAAVFENA